MVAVATTQIWGTFSPVPRLQLPWCPGKLRGAPKRHPHSWPTRPPGLPPQRSRCRPLWFNSTHSFHGLMGVGSLSPFLCRGSDSRGPHCAAGGPAEPPRVGAVRGSAGGLGSNPTRPDLLHFLSFTVSAASPVLRAPRHSSGHLSLPRRVLRPPRGPAAPAAALCPAAQRASEDSDTKVAAGGPAWRWLLGSTRPSRWPVISGRQAPQSHARVSTPERT